MSVLRKPDPTPEQIAAACAEIRAGWSAETYLARMRVDLRPRAWVPPGCVPEPEEEQRRTGPGYASR